MEEIKKKSPKISVIVPVYNSEEYLPKCIDSILSQTFTDFELILVNDGSKDGSPDICNRYEQLDDRIRVFHKANGGVSSARNLGLDKAKGEWILFVDSDDFISEDVLVKMSDKLNESIDLFLFNTNTIKEDLVLQRSNNSGKFADLQSYLQLNNVWGELWNYLFKRNIIIEHQIKFLNNIRVAEDRGFVIKYLSIIKTIKVLDLSVYNYREDNFSAMRSKRRVSDSIDHLQTIKDIYSFSIMNRDFINSKFIDKSIKGLFKITLSFSATSAYNCLELKEIKKQYKITYNTISFEHSVKDIQLNPFMFFINIIYYKFRLR